MCFTGDVWYSYKPGVSTDSNLSEPRNSFFSFGPEEWILMVRYPSGVAKGQGGPITSGQASSIQRNNLCSILPTSTPLTLALTLMLQGVFYDPITQRYTLSSLGVRLRFKIIYKDSSQVFPWFMSQWSQRFVCALHLWLQRRPITKVVHTRVCFFFGFFDCHICKVQPGVLFYFHLINSYLSDWEWYLKEKC